MSLLRCFARSFHVNCGMPEITAIIFVLMAIPVFIVCILQRQDPRAQNLPGSVEFQVGCRA